VKIHFLQHVPFENPGSILPWAGYHFSTISSTHFYRDDPLPPIHDYDCLVVMGGPMSVNDEAVFPWLTNEKRFIAEAIHRKLPVVGICLGAQLIASVLGSRVYRSHYTEIGWFEVKSTRQNILPDGDVPLPSTFTAFHWHGETFDPPFGAVHLARSEGCLNQAFLYEKKVLGLQFHLEATVENVHALLSNCRDEMTPGPFVQDEKSILEGMGCIPAANGIMEGLIEFLLHKPILP